MSDWLGTAATAATTAGYRLSNLRHCGHDHDPEYLKPIEDSLKQALEEVQTIRAHVARVTNGVQT